MCSVEVFATDAVTAHLVEQHTTKRVCYLLAQCAVNAKYWSRFANAFVENANNSQQHHRKV